jgi:hypothetical protein
MAKIKSVCGQCLNHCNEGFTVFQTQEKVSQLIEKYPFYKVVKTGTSQVGATKKEYSVIQCDRLKESGICSDYPQNSLAWCKVQA